ncbi:hypothetical protein TRICHSKD4_4645 [Roseibium sp. TrichSKD4]|nr:hypothetical protein TRICHSKD4_4645 [Roseibium sp. TrichSKD4]
MERARRTWSIGKGFFTCVKLGIGFKRGETPKREIEAA